MTRFIKTNTKKDAAPIYLRDDISVVYEDTSISPTLEISFYSAEDGRVLVLNKRIHNVAIEDFLPALTAAHGPYVRVPVFWSTEKEYAAAHIRTSAISYIAADEPQPLMMNPGHKGVRVTIGVPGIGAVTTHAMPMSDFGTLISALKTARPDLVRLLPKDAVPFPDNAKAAVTLVDAARIARLKITGDRLSILYRGAGTLDLQKPAINRDQLFAQAIADDPANDDPGKLAQIFNEAQRIRREDLQYIARSLAAHAPDLAEIEEATSLYFAAPEAISQMTASQAMGLNQLHIVYSKAFGSAYGATSDNVTFETPEKMEAALARLTGPGNAARAAPQPPRKPAGP